MSALRNKAIALGATDFGVSQVKGKRYYVIYKGGRINFGSKGGATFIDHGDKQIRRAWYARHSTIRRKDGSKAINDPYSASFWAARILWPK